MSDLIKNAEQVQGKVEQIQRDLESTEIVGSAGAGLVKLKMNGLYECKSVELDPSLMKEKPAVLEDFLVSAVNQAMEKIKSIHNKNLQDLSKGLELAG